MAKEISAVRTVNTKSAKAAILRCFETKRPVFLHGAPGIGKSELVESIAKELGGILYDVRLGQVESTDIRGIPFFNKELGVMDWAPPIDLPDEDTCAQYPIVVLMLDEFSHANPSVQKASYQLILNRRVGKYVLPDNVVVIAAGNRESDNGGTYKMLAPLANRFIHLEMKVDFDEWFEWAVSNKVHKDVVSYLSFAKNDLNNFDPRSSSHAFATPRSWTFVSDLLTDDANDETLTDLVSGTIGDGTAIKFMAYRKMAKDLPNPIDILEGRVTDKLQVAESAKISAMYSLTISMAYELQESYEKIGKTENQRWHDMVGQYFKYSKENFTTELAVLAGIVAFKIQKLEINPRNCKEFVDWSDKYSKILKAAQ